MLTKERKKQLDIDLWIILIISMLSLGIYMIFNSKINGIAGLGISVVSIMRKKSFSRTDYIAKNLY